MRALPRGREAKVTPFAPAIRVRSVRRRLPPQPDTVGLATQSKPGEMPSWRIAYVKFRDGTARHYYAQVGSADLFRTLLRLFAARYGKPIEDIVSIREVYKPDLFHRLLMRLYGAKPGHMLTLRMMHELQNAYQDMGLYRF